MSPGITSTLAENLMSRLRIGSTQRDNLYTLSFQDADPQKAQRVIQALVSIFVDSSLGSSRRDTDAAKAFIDEQIHTYETKLDEAEMRLKEFRLRNLELQNADGQDSTTRLAQIGAQHFGIEVAGLVAGTLRHGSLRCGMPRRRMRPAMLCPRKDASRKAAAQRSWLSLLPRRL